MRHNGEQVCLAAPAKSLSFGGITRAAQQGRRNKGGTTRAAQQGWHNKGGTTRVGGNMPRDTRSIFAHTKHREKTPSQCVLHQRHVNVCFTNAMSMCA